MTTTSETGKALSVKIAISTCATGLGVGLLVCLLVVATGGTFGQRCDKALPHDALASERCVYALSHGEKP